MHRRYPAFAILICSLCLAVSGGAEYKLVQPPDPADPMQVHLYQLDNGLTVYLSENHEEPRFHAEIAVRAGSKYDPPEATGMAHYLEHMLFKGTSRIGTLDYEQEKAYLDQIQTLYEEHFVATDSTERAQIYARINEVSQQAAQYAIPNEFDKLYTAMGEHGLNAFTAQEQIAYMVDLPSNRLEHWAKIEAERFVQPVFRLFQTELETVYEEMNQSYIDNKQRLIYYAVNGLLYKNHPYGRPIIGTVEHLKSPSIQRMYEFYHTYYAPNNMAVFISGDIDIPQTIALIDAEFSIWEPKKIPKPKKWKEKKIKEVERTTIFFPGEEYVLLAFRTAPSTHKDAEALKVLDMILDNAVAGLINLNLNQQQRVRQAGSYPLMYNDYGAQNLWGIPKEGQSLEEVEELLLEQIDLIKQGGFDEWIIPAIVTDFKKHHKQQLENNRSRVGLMRDAFISCEEWKRAVRELERMEKLRKKDIVKVAKKYFKKGYVAGYRRDGETTIPPVTKPALDKIEIDPTRQSAFFQKIMELPYEEIEPVYVVPGRDYKIKDLRPGVKLYYAQNPLNDLFTLSISVDFGLLADKRLAVARDFMDKSGTPQFNSEELKKEWYKLGTDFSISTSDHETSITISGLEENFAASLALLTEFMTDPTAEDATLDKLISNILKNREDAQKDHRTISRALYQFNRLGENSYYRRVPSNEQLQQLKREELHELIKSLLSYEQTLSYTGSLPLEKVLAQLEQHYVLPETLRQPPPYQPLEIREPAETEIYLFDKGIAQALVRIETGDEPYNETRRPAIQLYNEYFAGGMGGIVFQELREARALAYSAGARYLTGDRKGDQNLMVGVINCQADKSPEAVAAFLDLLENLPISPERFAAARRAQIQQYRTSRLGFRQVLGAVRTWERQDVPIDPRGWRFEQIRQATLNKVLDFHKERIKGRPWMVSIVGDKSKIDMEALTPEGKIIELELEDIFAF